MSDAVALKSSSMADEHVTNSAPRRGLGARLTAVLESCVTARSPQSEEADKLMFRYAPF